MRRIVLVLALTALMVAWVMAGSGLAQEFPPDRDRPIPVLEPECGGLATAVEEGDEHSAVQELFHVRCKHPPKHPKESHP